MLIFALALAAPTALTETHQRDIACVAAIAIIAEEQRRGVVARNSYPDVRTTGRRWAGIVGDRIVFESGQPRELVAVAITEAVNAEQARFADVTDPAAAVQTRVAECSALMSAELAAADAANKPLPKPVKAQ